MLAAVGPGEQQRGGAPRDRGDDRADRQVPLGEHVGQRIEEDRIVRGHVAAQELHERIAQRQDGLTMEGQQYEQKQKLHRRDHQQRNPDHRTKDESQGATPCPRGDP